jgi:hypothetical protein
MHEEDEKVNAFKIVVGRPQGKRPLGRPKGRREDNIKMDIREIDCKGLDWFQLAQDRVQWRTFLNMVTILWAP